MNSQISNIARRHNEEDDDTGFRPQLTSLIDVMTILLVFLLKNFSVEGELITPSKDLELPTSTIEKKAEPMFTVQISKNDLMVDGRPVTKVSSFAKSDSLLIPEFYQAIEGYVKVATAKEVMIEADRELPFNVIKRVMFTCSKAGLKDFSILVVQEGGE